MVVRPLRCTKPDRYSVHMTLTVLIADDHPLFREALAGIVLMELPGADIQHAEDYAEARAALAANSIDLAFVDLNMPNSHGLTDLALLAKMHPNVPIIVVSAHEESDVIRACIQHKASGYIIKSASPSEIKQAITSVLNGDIHVPLDIDLSQTQEDQHSDAANRISSLTPSQLKVLIEVGKGKLNKQIAYDLSISEATVKAHITSVFKKLGINNRTQAVLFAQQHQAKNPRIR
ncbi:response regulator transcription factor [Arenicella xantha]|uniref:LuxR family two component transcriptional regulator n=1 Tax=Arenicella xantha TaxID=644221 RepID=A0A395JL49_9GAMM|nr:response regulator transcription factor [Arenicella xantha]RBP51319.1 LuxR family two component transcriptional regulator [Arenicella xantha]